MSRKLENMGKNLLQRDGFINRHREGMPEEKCSIKILVDEQGKEVSYSCQWFPFVRADYSEDDMPPNGYLGTAKVTAGKYSGIAFHAWSENNSEFIWYSLD